MFSYYVGKKDAFYALHVHHSEARHVPPGDGGEGAGDAELSVVVAGGGLSDEDVWSWTGPSSPSRNTSSSCLL